MEIKLNFVNILSLLQYNIQVFKGIFYYLKTDKGILGWKSFDSENGFNVRFRASLFLVVHMLLLLLLWWYPYSNIPIVGVNKIYVALMGEK